MTGREISGVVTMAMLAGFMGMPTAVAVPTTEVVTSTIENPYGVITNRNAFGLQPPPDTEIPPPAPPPSPPPNVFLTGVSHQKGVKRAFFVINRPGAKTPEYESVMEGDEIQDLKIQEINAKDGKVRVLISGRELVLNFADNGLKSAAGPGPTPVPGRPGAGAVPQPVAPVPQPAGGGGPVVIGRGGVNLSENSGLVGNAVPSTAYAGSPEVSGQLPVNQAAVRTLPARAMPRGSAAADHLQSSRGVSESGAPVITAPDGSIPIPVPPPSRFQ